MEENWMRGRGKKGIKENCTKIKKRYSMKTLVVAQSRIPVTLYITRHSSSLLSHEYQWLYTSFYQPLPPQRGHALSPLAVLKNVNTQHTLSLTLSLGPRLHLATSAYTSCTHGKIWGESYSYTDIYHHEKCLENWNC